MPVSCYPATGTSQLLRLRPWLPVNVSPAEPMLLGLEAMSPEPPEWRGTRQYSVVVVLARPPGGLGRPRVPEQEQPQD